MKTTIASAFCGIILFGLLPPVRDASGAGEDSEQKFIKHVNEFYLKPNGKELAKLNPEQQAVYLGYALGRQAAFVQGNPEYRQILNDLHEKLMKRMDGLARFVSGESSSSYEDLRREYRELAEAAFAGYVDEQVERAIKVPERIPSIFAADRFSLRDFGLAKIAGPYTITPVGFQGHTYKVDLLTDLHTMGYKLTGGVATAWTFTETMIFFRNARGNVTWEFRWAGDGKFRGYPVFQNSPDTSREYRMERTDGEAFSSAGTGSVERGSERGGRGFTRWLKPDYDPEFARRISQGMGARNRVPPSPAGADEVAAAASGIPSEALDPAYITAHVEALAGYIKNRNFDGIRASISGKLADFFEQKGKRILTAESLPAGSDEALVRHLIPSVHVIVESVNVHAGNKTAEATVSLRSGHLKYLAMKGNKLFLIWSGSGAGGDWKIRDFAISPDFDDLKYLLELF